MPCTPLKGYDSRVRFTWGPLAIAVGLVLVLFATDWKLNGHPQDWVRPERSLTALGLVTGFFVLGWQLTRQHQNALRVETEKARNQLHLEIYKDLASASEAA